MSPPKEGPNFPGRRSSVLRVTAWILQVFLSCMIPYWSCDSILVMRFVEREEGHFSAYSLNTGECLGDYIYTGRGPKEMLSVRYEGQWERRDDSVWMYLYDLTSQQKFCAFNLTEAVCGDDIVLRSLGKVLPNTLSAYRLDDSTNLFRRITDNRIVYQTADANGSVSDTRVIYPEVTSNYFSIMTLKSAISPDGGKVASFLVAAPIFDILDLESGEHRSFTHVSDPGFKEDFEHFKSTGLFPPSVNQGYNPKVVGEYILSHVVPFRLGRQPEMGVAYEGGRKRFCNRSAQQVAVLFNRGRRYLSLRPVGICGVVPD